MKKIKLIRLAYSWLVTLVLGLAVVLISHAPLYALSFSWSGLPIAGEAGWEYPDFFPKGTAEFEIDGSEMSLLLTYTGASEDIQSINQTLTALTWEMEGIQGDLVATSAFIASGSTLIGLSSDTWVTTLGGEDDLSGQWCFKDNIDSESLGTFGVGAVGDINFVEDTFGPPDVIDPGKTLVTPVPNGVDFAIVGPDIILYSGAAAEDNPDGFAKNGPVVRNAMAFDFVFLDEYGNPLTQDLTGITITNVQPLFGTEGAPIIPEPTTMLLLGTGLIGLAGLGRKRFRKKN